jgi:CheY-like chemotaxis protein
MTDTRRRRLLFVDDEVALLQGLRLLLRKDRGRWDTEVVTSGAEALAALRAAAAAGTPFEVVVSDLRMPGMDGATLLATIRGEFPAAKRIVLSGHADPAMLDRVRPIAHVVLSKPCEGHVLREVLERALGPEP